MCVFVCFFNLNFFFLPGPVSRKKRVQSVTTKEELSKIRLSRHKLERCVDCMGSAVFTRDSNVYSSFSFVFSSMQDQKCFRNDTSC